MELFKRLVECLRPENDQASKAMKDGIDKFLEGINEEPVDKKMLHIEVTTHDIKNIDFITYDASGEKVHLVLHANAETGEIHVSDAVMNRVIIDSQDQLMAVIEVLQRIVRQIDWMNDTERFAKYYNKE